MASHFPPPLKAGGGASATALTTATIIASTLLGRAVGIRGRVRRAGIVMGWRWRKVYTPRAVLIAADCQLGRLAHGALLPACRNGTTFSASAMAK